MTIYKFLVPESDWRANPKEPTIQCSNILAIAVANSVDEAKDILRTWAQANGAPSWWLDVADVTPLDLRPGFVAWSQN